MALNKRSRKCKAGSIDQRLNGIIVVFYLKWVYSVSCTKFFKEISDKLGVWGESWQECDLVSLPTHYPVQMVSLGSLKSQHLATCLLSHYINQQLCQLPAYTLLYTGVRYIFIQDWRGQSYALLQCVHLDRQGHFHCVLFCFWSGEFQIVHHNTFHIKVTQWTYWSIKEERVLRFYFLLQYGLWFIFQLGNIMVIVV